MNNITIYLLVLYIFIFSACSKDNNSFILENVFLENSVDSVCLALDNIDFRDYDLTSNCKTTIVFDNFDKNNLNWYVGTEDDTDFSFQNGEYRAASEIYNYYTSCSTCNFIDTSSFELEVKIKLIQGTSYSSLNWGSRNSFKNTFEFGISKNRRYIISVNEDGMELDPIKKSTFSSAIDQNNFNKLTIRRAKGIHYFFINEKLIFETDKILLFGKEFNLSVGSGSSCSFDDFSYKNLDI